LEWQNKNIWFDIHDPIKEPGDDLVKEFFSNINVYLKQMFSNFFGGDPLKLMIKSGDHKDNSRPDLL
jgi:hypothetical protein